MGNKLFVPMLKLVPDSVLHSEPLLFGGASLSNIENTTIDRTKMIYVRIKGDVFH